MEIEYVPISELVPYASNPRKNDAAVKAVAASIQRFGFRNPIVLDRNGVVVAGHTRLKAAKTLGMESVPVIRADDLTDEQAKAFRLADNKAQELSSWDFSLLMDELTSIHDIDMTEFGFEQEEKKEVGESRRVGARTSNLDDGFEVDVDSFAEDAFNCECPECGFRFNE